MLGSARELMLFNFPSLLSSPVLPALCPVLRRIDRFLDRAGHHAGTAVWEPFDAEGEDQLASYLGMCGAALELTPEFPDQAPAILFTQRSACIPDAVERRIRLLKENGYNAIRSAHNPCSKTALEICDRLGVLVMDEYIDHWYIHKTLHDYVEYFDEWWKQDLKDMVEKDYNHPCVILYSTGNEVAETAQPRGIALTREMTEYLHSLDSSRPVTCGINIFFNFLNSIGFGQYSDEKAAKEAERNAKAREEGKETKESSTGSKFFNDLAGILGADFMKTGAALHGSDVKTRDAYAAMDIAGYNYGEKRYKKDLKNYPDRLILGSETFCADAYKFWELAKKDR